MSETKTESEGSNSSFKRSKTFRENTPIPVPKLNFAKLT